MIIINLNKNNIFHYLIFLTLTLFISCSPEKKVDALNKPAEPYLPIINHYMPNNDYLEQENTFTPEYFNTSAIVNEDNVKVYSQSDINSEVIYFLHNSNIVKISETDSLDNFNHVRIYYKDGKKNSYLIGYVHKKFLNIIQTPQTKSIILSNSKVVNINYFNNIRHDGFGPTDFYLSPSYLDSDEDWIIYDDTEGYWGFNGFSIHLNNLPSRFSFLLYSHDEQNILQYLAEKREFPIHEYKKIIDDDTNIVLDRIKPFYVVYFPSIVSSNSNRRSKHKVEIYNNIESSNVIYSTYIEFPEIPFKMTRINRMNLYLQYNIAIPFYLVLYKNDTIYERIPIAAFAIYPENDIWEGLLSFGSDFDQNSEYVFYLFRIDDNNPEDYTQEIKGYWGFPINFYMSW